MNARNARWLRRLVWAGTALAALFSVWHLGADVLEDYDEATYAIVIEDTRASGDLLTLRFGDDPWFDKPPLYFWLSMLASDFLGDTPFAYRLFSALAGVLSVAFVTLMARELTGSHRAAAIAGIVLATTAGFIEAARQVRLDVPVTAAVLFTCYAFVRGMRTPRWLTGAGIGVGIGIMLKSVIGLLSAPFILAWSVAHRDFRWLANRYTYIGAALALLIVLPWHIHQYVTHGAWFWQSYLGIHVLDRYRENILGGTASNDALLTFFLQGAFPWHLVFIILLGLTWIRHSAGLARVSAPALASVAAVLLVFTTAGTKIGYYLVPVYPFAALFIGIAGNALYERARGIHRSLVALVFAGFVALGIITTVSLSFNRVDPYETSQRIAREEKAAGLAIAAARTSEPVYISNWQYRETLRYYGEAPELQDFSERPDTDQPFFLILPREDYETGLSPDARVFSSEIIHAGESLTVLRVTPRR